MSKKQIPKYSPEVRERGVRMVMEHGAEHASQWAATVSIAAKIGCSAQTLHDWVAQAERDRGARAGLSTEERERMKALEREVRELRQANEILRQGQRIFCPGGARPPVQAMIAFIADHRGEYGVEPICRVLKIATFHAHAARRARLETAPPRIQRDEALKPHVLRVFSENFGSTASARSGGSCCAKASRSPAARSQG